MLISEDYSCTLDQGYRLAWFSELHGANEFPFRDDCPVLGALQDEGVKMKRLMTQDDEETNDPAVLQPEK